MFYNKLLKPSLFIYIFLLLSFILLSYHAIIYYLFTSKVLDVKFPYYVGDLARMSYQTDSIFLRKSEINLKRQHIEASQFQQQRIDVLTMGYSFSNGGAGGKNPYYQDYIATYNDFEVLNIKAFEAANGNVLTSLLALEKTGILEMINPKFVLIGSAQRVLIERFSQDIDLPINISKEVLLDEMRLMKKNSLSKAQEKEVSFINTANSKYIRNTFSYSRKPCARSVCKLPLKKSLFNVNADTTLLFYHDDVRNASHAEPKKVEKVNQNFNLIARRLKAKGISLYVMISSDKYELYHDYIENNPFEKSKLFELIEPLQKEYTFINTKKLLQPLIDKGEKDIYYADDTHWGYRASEEIFKHVDFTSK